MTIPKRDAPLATGVSKLLSETRDVLFLRWYMKFDEGWSVPGGSVHNGASISTKYVVRGRATPGIRADDVPAGHDAADHPLVMTLCIGHVDHSLAQRGRRLGVETIGSGRRRDASLLHIEVDGAPCDAVGVGLYRGLDAVRRQDVDV